MPRQLTTAQLSEYAQLYARRARLLDAYTAALEAGVQSATISTGGNSQSYTRISTSEILAALRAITGRLRELLGDPSGGATTVTLPDFAR